jgi:hypothetical protein
MSSLIGNLDTFDPVVQHALVENPIVFTNTADGQDGNLFKTAAQRTRTTSIPEAD